MKLVGIPFSRVGLGYRFVNDVDVVRLVFGVPFQVDTIYRVRPPHALHWFSAGFMGNWKVTLPLHKVEC